MTIFVILPSQKTDDSWNMSIPDSHSYEPVEVSRDGRFWRKEGA